MNDTNVLPYLRDQKILLGVWPCAIPHEWGGLTAESTKDGHRIPGRLWCVFSPSIKTTTSSNQALLVESFAVPKMFVGYIIGESTMDKPERINTIRTGLVLEFEKWNFKAPYIDPEIKRDAVNPALFVKAIDMVAKDVPESALQEDFSF